MITVSSDRSSTRPTASKYRRAESRSITVVPGTGVSAVPCVHPIGERLHWAVLEDSSWWVIEQRCSDDWNRQRFGGDLRRLHRAERFAGHADLDVGTREAIRE